MWWVDRDGNIAGKLRERGKLADFFNGWTLGEWATRVSVWFALVGYFLSAALAMRPAGGPNAERLTRAAWTWGAAWCLVHLACAFHYYHGWSHADAYRRTADQTALTTGIHWGGGLWLNYAMTLAWLTDTGWWWFGPLSRARRPRGVSVAWQVFLWFMVFNATAVFGHGAVRALGGLGCGWLMLLAARYTFFANATRSSSP